MFRNKILPLFIALYPVLAFSLGNQELKNIDQTLGGLNGELLHGFNGKSSICCDPEQELIDLQRQCALDLCGRPTEVESSYVTDRKFAAEIEDAKTDAAFKAFRPTIQNYVKLEKSKAKEIVKSIRESLSQKDYLSPSQFDNKAMAALLEGYLGDHIQTEIVHKKDGSREIKFSEVAPLPSKEAKLLLERYKQNRSRNMREDFLTGIFSEYMDLNEAKTHLNKMLQEGQERYERLKTRMSFGFHAPIADVDKALEAARFEATKMQDISDPFELTDVYFALQDLHYALTSELGDGYDKFDSKHEDFQCDDETCRKVLASAISDFDMEKKISMLEESLKDLDEDRINECRFVWYKQKIQTPEREKEKEFRKKIPQLLNKFQKEFVAKKFSPHSSSLIKARLEELKKHLGVEKMEGVNHEGALDEFKSSIAQKLSEHAENKEPWYPEDAPKLAKDMARIKSVFSYDLAEPDVAKALSDCYNGLSRVDDYSQKSHIHISAFSCNHQPVGEQIFAHELGHALSDKFQDSDVSKESRRAFLKQRKCVSSSYMNPPGSGARDSHPGDSQYTEEDMADVVAALVFKNTNAPLFSCSFIVPAEDERNWFRPTVLNDSPTDPHSSALFRVIMEAVNKEKVMPPSCRQVMDAFKDKVNFEKCE